MIFILFWAILKSATEYLDPVVLAFNMENSFYFGGHKQIGPHWNPLVCPTVWRGDRGLCEARAAPWVSRFYYQFSFTCLGNFCSRVRFWLLPKGDIGNLPGWLSVLCWWVGRGIKKNPKSERKVLIPRSEYASLNSRPSDPCPACIHHLPNITVDAVRVYESQIIASKCLYFGCYPKPVDPYKLYNTIYTQNFWMDYEDYTSAHTLKAKLYSR